MNILLPAWSFYPSQEGGPSNALYWLASGLAKLGHKVRVVTTNRCIKPGLIIENVWMQLNGFDVIYSSVHSRKNYLLEELYNCDLLLTNGVCSLRGFMFNVRALKLEKKIILSPRGELFDSAIFHKGKLYGLLKIAMFSVMKLAYRNKVIFHATSDKEVESIKKYMGQRANIILVPNYMILPDKVLPDSNQNPYLLYVGRLNQIKNIDMIIKGLSLSKKFMSSQVKFKIAGEKSGQYYESLIKQANELGIFHKIDFLGLVTGENKDRLYANAKCLLLMSKSENFGNVIVESLAQGTPVIASKGTPWQILNNKGAGWWIDADPYEIAKTVDDLLQLDNKQYLKMRDNAYLYSREFDIYENVEHWAGVLDMFE